MRAKSFLPLKPCVLGPFHREPAFLAGDCPHDRVKRPNGARPDRRSACHQACNRRAKSLVENQRAKLWGLSASLRILMRATFRDDGGELVGMLRELFSITLER